MANNAGTVQAMLRACAEAIEKKYPGLFKKSESMRESAELKPRAWKFRESGIMESRFHSKAGPRVLEAMKDGPDGEKVFKVILISEGPGNRRNKNYYGPEAVESSVKAFEGQWCFLNHQDSDEAESLPERTVEAKAGWYKNLGIIQVKEGSACAGELHCDLSESGAMLATKVQSALKYKESFPDNGKEYVGFSVNADGDAEPRDMTDKGGGPDDNYVTAITEGDSCDLVTTPARGGRGLAVIKEGQSGAVTQTSQEGSMKKKLQAIFARLSESLGLDEEDKKKLAESHKAALALVEAEGEGEADQMEAMCAKREGESDEDHLKRLHGMADAIKKVVPDPDEEDPENEDETETEEAKAVYGHSKVIQRKDGSSYKTKGNPLSPDERKAAFAHMDAAESKKDAIAGLVKESGMPEDYYTKEDLARFAKMPYIEAKREITKDAKLAKTIRESCTGSVASFHRGAVESEGGNLTKAFCEAARQED